MRLKQAGRPARVPQPWVSYNAGMSPGDSDELMLQQARERARGLLHAVGGDLDALRAAASESAYAEGAALCQDVAEATRQLLAQLEADAVHPTSPSETPHP